MNAMHKGLMILVVILATTTVNFNAMATCNMTELMKDRGFVDVLGKVNNNSVTCDELRALKARMLTPSSGIQGCVWADLPQMEQAETEKCNPTPTVTIARLVNYHLLKPVAYANWLLTGYNANYKFFEVSVPEYLKDYGYTPKTRIKLKTGKRKPLKDFNMFAKGVTGDIKFRIDLIDQAKVKADYEVYKQENGCTYPKDDDSKSDDSKSDDSKKDSKEKDKKPKEKDKDKWSCPNALDTLETVRIELEKVPESDRSKLAIWACKAQDDWGNPLENSSRILDRAAICFNALPKTHHKFLLSDVYMDKRLRVGNRNFRDLKRDQKVEAVRRTGSFFGRVITYSSTLHNVTLKRDSGAEMIVTAQQLTDGEVKLFADAPCADCPGCASCCLPCDDCPDAVCPPCGPLFERGDALGWDNAAPPSIDINKQYELEDENGNTHTGYLTVDRNFITVSDEDGNEIAKVRRDNVREVYGRKPPAPPVTHIAEGDLASVGGRFLNQSGNSWLSQIQFTLYLGADWHWGRDTSRELGVSYDIEAKGNAQILELEAKGFWRFHEYVSFLYGGVVSVSRRETLFRHQEADTGDFKSSIGTSFAVGGIFGVNFADFISIYGGGDAVLEPFGYRARFGIEWTTPWFWRFAVEGYYSEMANQSGSGYYTAEPADFHGLGIVVKNGFTF